jgi:hypothetical protein
MAVENMAHAGMSSVFLSERGGQRRIIFLSCSFKCHRIIIFQKHQTRSKGRAFTEEFHTIAHSNTILGEFLILILLFYYAYFRFKKNFV